MSFERRTGSSSGMAARRRRQVNCRAVSAKADRALVTFSRLHTPPMSASATRSASCRFAVRNACMASASVPAVGSARRPARRFAAARSGPSFKSPRTKAISRSRLWLRYGLLPKTPSSHARPVASLTTASAKRRVSGSSAPASRHRSSPTAARSASPAFGRRAGSAISRSNMLTRDGFMYIGRRPPGDQGAAPPPITGARDDCGRAPRAGHGA